MHSYCCVEKLLLGYIYFSFLGWGGVGYIYILPFRACWDISLVLGLEAKGVSVVGPEENEQCLTKRGHLTFFRQSRVNFHRQEGKDCLYWQNLWALFF